MDKKTCVLITTGIFPPDVGGPATMLERLSSDLVNAGFGVTVLTYGSPEKKARPFKLSSVLRQWPLPLRQIIFFVKTFFLASQADIIYTIDLYSPGYYSMIAAKFWRKKLVVRFAGDSAWETALNRGLTQDDISAFQEKKYGAFIEKRKNRRAKILKSADGIVAVSEFMKNLAVRIGVNSEKIKVIYNAVDFFEKIPDRIQPSVPTLVYSGRLTPWKGVGMLIRIVGELKRQYLNITFEILGDGSELEELKALAKNLGLVQNVKFHGNVSEEESHSVFARSTIFVLNTNYEGLSHAILNALNVGVPVITTPVGGNPEVIRDGENGLLAPFDDEIKWLAAVERLLADKALQEKFSENGKKTLARFKWAKLLDETVKTLKAF
jgi:glycosyltransferase involved in cell wall biosynthesis